ncbi:DUF6985 domain-containing protein [Actinokineospora sp. NPDC004072]
MPLVVEGYDEDPRTDDFHDTIRAFLALDPAVLSAAAPSIFACYLDVLADDGEDLQIESPDDVLKHVELGDEPTISRDGDGHVYVSLGANATGNPNTASRALSLRRHHSHTLIVPMSLIRDAYREEILSGLADAGEEVLHVFLDADAEVLRRRLSARVPSHAEPASAKAGTRMGTEPYGPGRQRPPAARHGRAALGPAHPGRTCRRGAGSTPQPPRPRGVDQGDRPSRTTGLLAG